MKDLCPGLAHPWVSAKGKQQQTKKLPEFPDLSAKQIKSVTITCSEGALPLTSTRLPRLQRSKVGI